LNNRDFGNVHVLKGVITQSLLY